MTTNQKFAIFSILAFSLVCFSAHFCKISHPFSNEENIKGVVAALDFDPGELMLKDQYSTDGKVILRHIFEGLTRLNSKGKITNGIAEHIHVSENGYEYTFELRKSKWSDGKIVTAYDFARSWREKIENKNILTPLECIKNVKAFQEGLVSWEDVGINPINKYVLKVTLEKPLPYFLYLTSTAFFLPQHPESSKEVVVTNGPFLIDNWQANIRLVLKKNPFYWAIDEVKIPFLEFLFIANKKVAMSFLENGNIDFAKLKEVHNQYQHSTENLNSIYVTGQTGITCAIVLNPKNKLLSSLKIRKALSKSIIRDDIVQFVVKMGSKANSLVPPIISKRVVTNSMSEDLAKAKELLEEGLKDINMSKEDFNDIFLTISNETIPLKIIKAIQEQWKKTLDIDVPIRKINFDVQTKELQDFSFNMWTCLWRADYPDPMSFLEPFKKNGLFGSELNIQDVTKIIEKAEEEEEFNKRLQLLIEAEDVLLEKYIVIPIYFPSNIFGIHRNLKNVYFDPLCCTDFSRAFWTS